MIVVDNSPYRKLDNSVVPTGLRKVSWNVYPALRGRYAIRLCWAKVFASASADAFDAAPIEEDIAGPVKAFGAAALQLASAHVRCRNLSRTANNSTASSALATAAINSWPHRQVSDWMASPRATAK
jgi:hypothetical protein